eukprot:8016873-Alexandrium_andersonii.AAC.1
MSANLAAVACARGVLPLPGGPQRSADLRRAQAPTAATAPARIARASVAVQPRGAMVATVATVATVAAQTRGAT